MKKILLTFTALLLLSIASVAFSQSENKASEAKEENSKENIIEYKSSCLDYFEKWNAAINKSFDGASKIDPSSDNPAIRKQLDIDLTNIESELERYKAEFDEFQKTGNCKTK